MTRILAALLALAATLALAQPKEGELATFANRDTKDVQQRLQLMTHTLYAQQQQVITILFREEYRDRVKMKLVWLPAKDNTLVPAWIFTPAKMDSTRKYPGLVMVHGAFHGHFNETWFRPVAMAVEQGYVVIYPEYRGSRGDGAEIYKSDYGRLDTSDTLDASRYFARQPFVDAQRMAIYGHSRGGMIALLAIQQEPRLFKAAVHLTGLADFVAWMSYKAEWRRQETARENPSFKGKTPDENLPAYMEISPVFHVDKIEIPVFVVATTGDKTAPWELHAARLIDALKARGKVHEAKLYERAPGDHNFYEGDTEEADDAFRRIFEFIGKYVK
jgi:dipeptidyl aminopeptidase/acylaminoacyl peptidase